MTDENGATNYRLTREAAELRGKLEMVIKEQEEDNVCIRELFQRLNALERRMAQIVLVAGLLSTCAPILISTGMINLNSGHAIQKAHGTP